MRILLIFLVLLIAAGAGFFVLQSGSETKPKQVAEKEPQVQAVNVLVARQEIPLGAEITKEMIDQQPWPRHLVLDGFIVAGSENANIEGMVTRSTLQVQEPISRYKLANPDDANFLAAALPEGMRALTLKVDAISGVAGYVYPGDRVDIVLTHKIPFSLAEAGGNAPSQRASAAFSETILSDIKVLAVDIRGVSAFQNNAQNQRRPEAPKNVTVEVTPEQAQAIRLAERNGNYTMALRSLKERGLTQVVGTELSDISGINISSGGGKKDDGVFIIRGVEGQEATAGRMIQASEGASN